MCPYTTDRPFLPPVYPSKFHLQNMEFFLNHSLFQPSPAFFGLSHAVMVLSSCCRDPVYYFIATVEHLKDQCIFICLPHKLNGNILSFMDPYGFCMRFSMSVITKTFITALTLRKTLKFIVSYSCNMTAHVCVSLSNVRERPGMS